jgi:rubrerythrin
MDLTRRAVRRHLDEIARRNDAAMARQREALTRMVETGELDADQTDELVTGGLQRRRLLTLGGLAVATSAVVAACGSSSKQAAPTTTVPTTSTTVASTSTGSAQDDVTTLRTASSLEHLAVETYQSALGTGLVTDPSVKAAAQTFAEQHGQHASAFEAATTQAGGTPFTTANPVVKAQLVDPAVAKLKTQTDVVVLAYQLESAASQTYQANVGTFSKVTYNKTVASVLGVESRHVALIGILLQQMQQPAATYPAYPTNGFATAPQAVKPGTGVS